MSDKILKGTVVSCKMKDTIKVKVSSYKMHKKYNKKYIWHKLYNVHCLESSIVEGDNVVIQACRPISKTKTWMFKEKI
jgi:small subunit ribosomal protein S17